MADVLKFVHLTDLHFSALGTGEPTLLGDTTQALRNSFAAIDRMSEPPAFIVISGDLTDRGNEEDYAALKPLLAQLAGDVPLLLALGNHDRRGNFYKAFSIDPVTNPLAPYDHDVVVAGLHVIVLDSSVPGRVGGAYSQPQIDWLAQRLAAHSDRRKLIVTHHSPLFDPQRGEVWDRLDLTSTQALRNAIAGCDVVGILSGHVHMEEVTNWYGVPVIVGVGHHAATDPLAPSQEIRLVDATGLTLCTLRPSGLGATFVPHPQDRRTLRSLSTEAILSFDAAAKAAQSAAADK